MTLLLLAGLAAVFVGVMVALSAAASITNDRSSLARTLSTIEAAGPLPDSMREEIDRPFSERIGLPLRTQALSLGQRLTPADWSDRIRRKLDLAGSPAGWDAERVLAAKVAWALVLGGVTLVLGLLAGWGLLGLIAAAGLTVLGFLGPDLWLSHRADRRNKEMRRSLADSLDLLTISVESGLAFDGAVQHVAENTTGPLSDEFKRTLREMQLGTSRADALRAMSERTQVKDLNYIVTALVQADKLGIPITQVLRVQAEEMRLKRTQAAEEAAAKLPVKILFPVMFCIMPAVFVVILGPAGITMVEFFTNS